MHDFKSSSKLQETKKYSQAEKSREKLSAGTEVLLWLKEQTREERRVAMILHLF